jgi:hypothetical protein
MRGILILLASGCDEFGLAGKPLVDSASDTAEEEQDCSFCIEELSPAYGPPAGGTAVSITGQGFDGTIGVRFGNMELEVSRLSGEELLITTPSSPSEGSVDVTVFSETQETTAAGGFTYTADGSPPEGTDTGDGSENGTTEEDSGSGGGSATGLTGGLVELAVQGYVIPELSPTGQQVVVTAGVTLHSPVEGSWLDWVPPAGTCYAEYTDSTLPVAGTDLGSQVYLEHGGTSISLPKTTSGGLLTYSSTNLNQTQISANASYALSAPNVGLDISDVALISTDFTDISPIGPFLPGDVFTEALSASNFSMSWAPTSTGEVLLVIEFLDYSSGVLAGMLLCSAEDTGALALPESMLQGYLGYNMTVQLYRTHYTEAIHPENGSTIQGFSMMGLVGTGWLNY